jgi:hypothetical protein
LIQVCVMQMSLLREMGITMAEISEAVETM